MRSEQDRSAPRGASHTNILLLAEAVEDGETHRMDCPACGRSKTFTITRKDGQCVWNCYSVHCSEKGATGSSNRPSVVRTTLTRPEPRKQRSHPFTGELRDLTPVESVYLATHIGFTEQHLSACGVRYAPTEGRYAYPIYAPTGQRRGWVLREYDGNNPRWKALTRLDREEPHLSWYTGSSHSNRVLVVEDIPSAVRAAVHYPGWVVAMCGGGIGPDYVRELTAYAKHVVWAFDGDATAAAISHHRRYGLCFESSSVLPLEKDLKDMDEDQIKEVLSHVS